MAGKVKLPPEGYKTKALNDAQQQLLLLGSDRMGKMTEAGHRSIRARLDFHLAEANTHALSEATRAQEEATLSQRTVGEGIGAALDRTTEALKAAARQSSESARALVLWTRLMVAAIAVQAVLLGVQVLLN